ncbi:Ppx/GppA phosphatase family protein [Arsenicicoccus sp. oral taxon 190]|uniref:Ppx/GppA phosphatase family protein n=1 Tax=Arsenicicoccus sp. oral taxon 190 TaxID=1658671 RepID=UPI00067A39F9|nr:Ppx/GppA phosphatase family protein [Arsenicicoccus sp. oral taxon 190]AKT50183.1 exopolyphosphatase [Arsenicicoccus sp. oral taxon 190]
MSPGAAHRVAAIDCGTNSIRLLVADVDPATRAIHDVTRRMEVVRLGEGVDRTGRISDAAMARALARCEEYAEDCHRLGVERARFVATSASRDASNAADFAAGVQGAFRDLDLSPEVVSGAEEAELSFLGATGDLAAAGVPGPYLVVDVGGGSTELVRGTTHVEAARSVDMGCVRFTERHLHHDPPTSEEVAAALADVDAHLEEALATVPLAGVRTLVGVAGTVTTVAAHVLRLPHYDSGVIHLSQARAEEIGRACEDLVRMPREQIAALGFMHPGRVDVIAAGALLWGRVVERVVAAGADPVVVVSERDILDGVCLGLAAP